MCGEMGCCAQRRGGVGGSRGTTTGGQVCRGGLLIEGWYEMRGVHRGVKLGGEAMAVGVNMGFECDRWDGGVQDSRSASSAKGFSASESHGSS